ncbi:MAG: tetratricopeptide TPR_4 [uncultured bacterium]|nr:MAG: tetratricopeptide TPR_4 [uncultured bacterium]
MFIKIIKHSAIMLIILFLFYITALKIGDLFKSSWLKLNQKSIKEYNEGNYENALKYAKQSLAAVEKLYKPDDFRIALVLNNIASIYNVQGKSFLAVPLLKFSIEIDKKYFGETETLALDLNNLAETYQLQGKYLNAEPLFLQAIKILEDAKLTANPKFTVITSNYAENCIELKKFDLAKNLLTQALSISESFYGADDPGIITSLYNLANYYLIQKEYDISEKLLNRAIDIINNNNINNKDTSLIKDNIKKISKLKSYSKNIKT